MNDENIYIFDKKKKSIFDMKKNLNNNYERKKNWRI